MIFRRILRFLKFQVWSSNVERALLVSKSYILLSSLSRKWKRGTIYLRRSARESRQLSTFHAGWSILSMMTIHHVSMSGWTPSGRRDVLLQVRWSSGGVCPSLFTRCFTTDCGSIGYRRALCNSPPSAVSAGRAPSNNGDRVARRDSLTLSRYE